MNAWKNTHLPSTVIQSERPEDLLPFLGLTLSEFSLPPEVTAYSLHTSKSAVEWGKERASFVQPGVIENVRKITDHHIMRLGGEPQQEMQAIDLISSSTEIPAPKIRNSPTSEKPGPMAGLVRGALFEHEDIYNVFPTWVRLQCWCEALGSREWKVIARLAKQEPSLNPVKPLPAPLSSKLDYRRLVFTHGDIHPGNLIFDIDGHLWMIDWDDSRYYPIWFESLGMTRYRERLPPSWSRWIWFVAGEYPETEVLWSYVREAVYDRI
ncbi:hypothetical protein PIIN_08352 [Serendipita indica DSM 11827]|uniref:Aminoglycoside phosphotransferase domain-containing protein n=1 Tax=Serendipita indica (strain DSM 11827) TaxID=1109443 RepID=G4TSV7_SERID|nr:hypothetical protein PIIN_08352 [Serendipita indica DSM 11827]